MRAYSTIGIEGGITTPMLPALAIKAAENSRINIILLPVTGEEERNI